MRPLVYIIAFLLFTISSVNAQDNKKCRWVKINGEPLLLDSLSVLPQSIVFSTTDSIAFDYDLDSGEILITRFPEGKDVVEVCYTVLPFSLHQKVQHRNLTIYDSSAFFEDNRNRYNTGLFNSKEELFPTEGLTKNGSISRGILPEIQ